MKKKISHKKLFPKKKNVSNVILKFLIQVEKKSTKIKCWTLMEVVSTYSIIHVDLVSQQTASVAQHDNWTDHIQTFSSNKSI